MNERIFQVDAYGKTGIDAIHVFCEQMFDDRREVDPTSIVGEPFSSGGLSFRLIDGINTFNVIYNNKTKVYEFFKQNVL